MKIDDRHLHSLIFIAACIYVYAGDHRFTKSLTIVVLLHIYSTSRAAGLKTCEHQKHVTTVTNQQQGDWVNRRNP
jgi:hypothetical protein